MILTYKDCIVEITEDKITLTSDKQEYSIMDVNYDSVTRDLVEVMGHIELIYDAYFDEN